MFNVGGKTLASVLPQLPLLVWESLSVARLPAATSSLPPRQPQV